MFNTLYLLSYNNYYNRLVKKEETIQDYMPYVIFTASAINFNPSDNVSTKHICNIDDDLSPDYAILLDDSNNIVSRWFIIDQTRIRGNQWELTLVRDVVVDYYNIIINAPCYVNKGYVDTSNPLIYNSENVSFNQIKKGEYLLENELGTPWLVAYLSRLDGEGTYNTFAGSFIDDSDVTPDYVLDSLDEYKYNKYVGTDINAYIYTDDIKFCMFYNSLSEYDNNPDLALDRTYGLTKSGYYYASVRGDTYVELPLYTKEGKPTFSNSAERQLAYDNIYNKYLTYGTIDAETGLAINSYTGVGSFEDYQLLSRESDKIIQVGPTATARYYRIQTNIDIHYKSENRFYINNTIGSFGNYIMQQLQSTGHWTQRSADAYTTPFIIIPYENQGIYLTISEIHPAKKVQYNFTYNSNVTYQTPYEIIAAPLNDIALTKETQTINHNGAIALSWFMDLAQKGSNLVYDVQILPYSPITDTDISQYKIAVCYYEGAVDTPLACAIKLPVSSFTQTYFIPDELPQDNDYKVSVNCDLYRLCSPNGIGIFDFSPAKNNGLYGYEVDCTMLPYNPYIKINPIFNTSGLYGGDYNDYRGLICGGDFSLSITSDQWEQYQLNNKNYQAMFDRENQSIETQQQWERGQAWATAGAGVVGGMASGALAGSVVPGIGTAIGAIAGGLASAVGGGLDITKTYKLQAEQMASRKDLFELSLASIKARPNSLARTTAYNINNKYFPYIEYYSCTDEEKKIFKNKIKYEGMTINALGTIKDFLGSEETFIKGRIIRLENLNDDYHIAQTIVSEILEGVYIGGN